VADPEDDAHVKVILDRMAAGSNECYDQITLQVKDREREIL